MREEEEDNNTIIKVKEQTPPASPPRESKPAKKIMEVHPATILENHIKCEIRDIQEFKWCLDSVKFPTGPKKFNVGAAIFH